MRCCLRVGRSQEHLFVYLMSRVTYTIFGKALIIFLLSLVLSLPLPAHTSNKTLVLLPLVIYADKPLDHVRHGVRSMLVSRLSGGGLQVISDGGLEPLLGQKEMEGITSKGRAEELAKRLGADYAIFGSITAIGGGYSLDLSLLELHKDGSRLTRVSRAIDEDQFIPKLSDVAHQLRALIEGKETTAQKKEERAPILPKPERAKGVFSKVEPDRQGPAAMEKGLVFKPTREYEGLKPTGKISVDMAVMAFDMGDLDGDGEAELVILGRKKLLVYSKKGEPFALRDGLKPSFGEDFLKVSVGDVDNNGRAEIYLVSRYGVRARSTVLEWAGKFTRLDRRTGHLQAVKDPGGSTFVLLFQDSRVDEFFSGRIYAMSYDKEGKVTRRERLPELRGVQFNTLALFDLDRDGDPEFLGLGEDSRLHVWGKQGNTLWSGGKRLGGTNNAIRLGSANPGDPPTRIPFNSRLLITDIDGDGSKEILAIKNIPLVEHLRSFKVFTKSNLIAYRIEGTSLFPAWTTGDIDYCLTDMQAEGPTLFVAAQKDKLSNIGKGSGLIMWFE